MMRRSEPTHLSVVLVAVHVDVNAVLLHQRHEEVLELGSVVVAVSNGEDCNARKDKKNFGVCHE